MLKAAILGFLKGYLLKAATGLVGWRLQLAKLAYTYAWPRVKKALDYVEKKLILWIGEEKIERQTKINEENAVKYEEALKDGGTQEQLEDATSDFLNGRKH